MRFFLGTHESSWLGHVGVPLFVSRRRLLRRKPRQAAGAWSLDSGGFTELSMHGRWTFTEAAYVADVRRFAAIGQLQWAAPMDWMCEPFITAKTGLTVEAHQRHTVENFLSLREELGELVIPVLQGWTLADYERCATLYEAHGVRLGAERTVGLGSVCRRQATSEIGAIVRTFKAEGFRLHGFGVKSEGIARYGHMLESADSLAWSYTGRRDGTCAKASRCANCLHFALEWRERVLDAQHAPRQLELGGVS